MRVKFDCQPAYVCCFMKYKIYSHYYFISTNLINIFKFMHYKLQIYSKIIIHHSFIKIKKLIRDLNWFHCLKTKVHCAKNCKPSNYSNNNKQQQKSKQNKIKTFWLHNNSFILFIHKNLVFVLHILNTIYCGEHTDSQTTYTVV